MRWSGRLLFLYLLPGVTVALGQNGAAEFAPAMADPRVREERVAELRSKSEQAMERARAWAAKNGEPMRRVIKGRVVALVDYTEERGPVYRATRNVNAAISTGANQLRLAPYNLSGTNILAGIWDGGNVRATHTEFSGRVTNIQSVVVDDHATHVAGTMIARGAAANALGMAPQARLDAYDFNDDLSEMTGRAMATPGQAGKIQISNHSYGYIAGWDAGFSPIRWYGTWTNGVRESDDFGQYSSIDRDLDNMLYGAPYYLPFWSAGNDRNDAPPSNGTTFQYYSNGAWRSTSYDSAIHPFSDGWKNGGYDTISFGSVAKNIMVIGAVNDAVTSGSRDLAKATMTSFSAWGPTDDGRIKPDIVANGAGLYSSLAGSDTSYGIYDGTSMSSPNASGSALLILQRYAQLFPGQYLRASAIKALLIHTADDLAPAGPDYKTGWGLMNVKAAADHLALHAGNTNAGFLVEGRISTTNTVVNYDVVWNQSNALKATIAWTDPPGVARTGLNNTNLNLRNNLNLRIITPAGTTNFPWILNPSIPTNPATTGNNFRDNVEQVLIASPGAAGTYRVQVTYSGTLSNNFQNFSLVMSGIQPVFNPATSIRLEGALEAGFVEAGVPHTRMLTIHNDGSSAVTVTNLTYPPGFSGAWTGAVPSLGSRDVPVTIFAATNGSIGGTLVVRFAESTNTATRAVSAFGVRTFNLAMTNPPPAGITVSNAISAYDLRGVAGTSLVGQLVWTNDLNGASGNEALATNWVISAVPLAVGSNIVSVTATNRPAGVVSASDNANQAAYADGWNNGDNGGLGFHAWILATNGPWAGHFIANSAANTNLASAAEAWGLWANSGSEANAYRPLGQPLRSGDTVRVTIENSWINSGSSVGVALLNGNGQHLVEFFFSGGAATYTLNDALGARNSGVGYTDAGLSLAFTLTGPTSYVVQAGATQLTGHFAARTDMNATRFRAWNFNAGVGENYNFYFHDLSVSNPPTGAALATTVVATIVRRGLPPVIDPIPALTTSVGQAVSYPVTASNLENDPMTFAVTTAVAGATWSFDTNSGFFVFTPNAAQTGVATFAFTAFDRDGASAPAIMSVTVWPAPAPPVFDPVAPVPAFTATPTSFTVRAFGFPEPVISLESTTASSGYDFAPGSGVLAYTPPYVDAGTQTFTFVAANSEGAATQVVDVIVQRTPPAAPAAIWVAQPGVTYLGVQWSASAGATGYVVEAHTHPSFLPEIPGSGGRESFSDIGPSSGSYATRIWTNNGVVWQAEKARTDYTYVGQAIGLQNASGAFILSGTMTGGVDEIALAYRRNTGSAAMFDILVNTTKVATLNMTTSFTTNRITGIGHDGPFTLMISNSGANVARFDELSWTNHAQAGGAYVPGFESRAEPGVSATVTGLTAGSTYYLRVRAVNEAGSSDWSPVASGITLTSPSPQTITFPNPGDQAATNTVLLEAEAESGLPVTFAVIEGPAHLDGASLTFTATGEVAVAAYQAGDANWEPAEPVTNRFLVSGYFDGNTNDIDDAWELQNFGSLTVVTEASDFDFDGLLDWQEYIAGTDPTNAGSTLVVDAQPQLDGSYIIQWTSQSNRWYAIGRKADLLDSYLYITSGIPGLPPLNVVTDAPPGEGPWFYRVRVGWEP